MKTFRLDPDQIQDLRPEVLDEYGRFQILPADYWAATTVEERALLGHRTGMYSFPTTELVAHLRELIGGRTAIEVGAGNGVLAQALNIPATDNKQQLMPRYRTLYDAHGLALVPYGENIIEMDASHAVRYFRPAVVIGCWVTHRYDPTAHHLGGNEIGLDEPDLLHHCEEYVMVGNEDVHKDKPVWSSPHEISYPPFVYSRAHNGSRDFVAVFKGSK